MLSAMRLAPLVLLFVVTSAAADGRTAVESLPEIARIEKNRVVVIVRGEVDGKARRAQALLVEQVVADVERRFLATSGAKHRPFTLALFDRPARYREVAREFGPLPSDWGFYMPGVRIALANIGASIGNLRHELVHPLIDDDFAEIPAWLSEGLGALYGTARWNRNRFEFLVNYRLKDLKRALNAGTLPTLAELAASTDEDVRVKDPPTYYAYGRYVLLYLDRNGTLSKFYAEMRGARGDVGAQTEVLERFVDERAFRTWAKRLR
jgi:hypothetical protein